MRQDVSEELSIVVQKFARCREGRFCRRIPAGNVRPPAPSMPYSCSGPGGRRRQGCLRSIRRREVIVRRWRTACAVVVMVSLLWTVPAAAQPDGSATSWGAFAGRVVDWVAALWRVVAGSETEPPPAEPVGSDGPDGVALDGSGDLSDSDTQGEGFPKLDPDG